MNEAALRRLRPYLPVLGYLAVVLALFGSILVSRDFILSAAGEDLDSYYVGMRRFGFDQLARGNLPLWNPLIFGGTPYFGNFESALLYPPNWLHLILPPAPAINLGIALHVFLAGFFTFLWRRRAGAGELAAFVSGLIYMLCGPFYMHVFPGHLSNLCVMAWVPLLFLALDAWFATGDAGWCLLGTFVVTMQILAGHPQYIYYTAMGAALYTFLRTHRAPGGIRLALGVAGMYAGAAALSAVQLMTGLQAVGEMTRGVGSQFHFARTFPLAPESLLTALMPGVFGDMLGLPYFGRWHLWEGSLFVGVAGLVLAALGAAERDSRGRRPELVMVCAALFLALGVHAPLYDVLYAYLPGYSMFRGTSKFIFLAGLFLAALAGAGLDRLERRRGWPVAAAAAAGLLGALLTGVWAWLSWPSDAGQLASAQRVFEWFGRTKETFLPPPTYHSVSAALKAAAFAAGEALRAGRSLLVVSVLLYLCGRSRRWRFALAAYAAFELVSFAAHNRVVTRLEAAYPPQWTEAARAQSGDFRVLHIGLNARNAAMYAGVQDAWGYSPLLMKRYFEITDYLWHLTTLGSALTPREMMRRNPLLALLRARLIFLNNAGKDILTADVNPRVRLVENWEAIAEPEKIFNRLMTPGFDSSKTILLERAPDPLPEKGGASGTVAVTASDTDWLELEAVLPRPAILFVGDVYSEHWRVRALEPGPQDRYEIMPAYHALRAVALAAGRHRLRMEYRPSGFYVGRWVSLAALAVFLWLCALRGGLARPPRLPRPRVPAGAALAAAFVLVEFAGLAVALNLGLWSSSARRDPDLGWVQPYPGVPPEKPEILFLGDSVTAGGELPDSRWRETFAGLLGGWNAGVDGYGTYQERTRYVRDLKRLGAGKVALVVCFNDLMGESESREMIRTTLRDNFDVGETTLLDYEPWYRIIRWLRARAAKRAWTETDPDESAFAVSGRAWREWTGAIAGLKKDAAPARLYVALAPLRTHVRQWREGRREFPVNRRLARFCADNGIPFLDLLPAFARADASEYRSFGDPFHFTAEGHRIAAAALRPFLEAK